MGEREWNDPVGGAQASPGADPGQILHEEKRAAERLVDDAKAAAGAAGAQAKEAAAEKAEELQGMAASHLRNFAEAMRTASDELAAKDPGLVSDIVRQATQGLEQLSGSLERRSSVEMIDGVRDFGRQNPVGFLAGAMLAGFSLARFAGSGAPSGLSDANDPSRKSHGAAPGAGPRFDGEASDATAGAALEPAGLGDRSAARSKSEGMGQPMTSDSSGRAPSHLETPGVTS